MKKIIALLMVALIAVSLAACVPTPGDLTDLVGNAIENKVEDKIEDKVENKFDIDVDTNDDDVDVDVDIDVDDNDNTKETVTVNMGTVTEQVLYNKDGIKVTVDDISYKEYYGPTLSMLVENESAKNVTVSAEKLTVNNIVMSSYFYADVNSGKKMYEDMYFYQSELDEYGITELGTVEFCFNIYEQESYDTIDKTDAVKIVLNDKVSGLPTPNGEKIYDKNGITVYKEECPVADDDYYDYVTRFLLINASKEDVTVSATDISVNGFMVNSYCYLTAPAGKAAYENFYFTKDTLKENKITEIEEVEFSFNIYNSNTYDTIELTDPYTIKVK